MNGGSFGGCQIFLVVARLHECRHTIMNWRHQLIRFARQDCESPFPVIGLWIFPELPNRSHSKGFLAENDKLVLRFLLAFLYLLPFKDGIPRNDATSCEKRILPEVCMGDTLGACIEE